jgi:hypothetical protein
VPASGATTGTVFVVDGATGTDVGATDDAGAALADAPGATCFGRPSRETQRPE